MMSATTWSIDSLESWATRLLVVSGLAAQDAAAIAGLIVRTEARGVVTHGLSRLPSYVEKLQSGEYNAHAHITHTMKAGAVRLDGDGAMGQLAGLRAIEKCCELAREQAVTLCFARNLGHLGAVGLYPLIAAERGFVAIAIQRTPPLLAMPGSSGPLIGHNPIAFAAPIPDSEPLVFDMACSVAARGHVLLAVERGEDIPGGWAVDEFGTPTTDAKSARDGMLLPFGGYKGLGIAMLGEILAGSLAADMDDRERMQPAAAASLGAGALGGQTAFFLVINPALATETLTYAALATDWTRQFAANAGPAARLPGQRAATLERAARDRGVPVASDVVERLLTLSERLGVAAASPMQ
ncbi:MULTISPECIES: Ldh family oxidoreductase [unclassified Beijerinckia]|uniref:Ldh family oxidoreductase n=1 Tax=unclassified Beijerinckia TaxID=2638183 RepID=UPI000898BD30|nr:MULTISPECIES: Ldh family oxidoreductase [unclassified Beijerinckia]MDH7798960.1 LDH2 family malate/lactate/ureidoglycolate dehydrogenase [Beijerinckia sp. GAS462]SED85865.1 Malate/lactate/ureidoglycolate dehydrogenase, LDH2 family [Beijerinckia sp. 28-YEA-48]